MTQKLKWKQDQQNTDIIGNLFLFQSNLFTMHTQGILVKEMPILIISMVLYVSKNKKDE